MSELFVFSEKCGLDKNIVRMGLHQVYGHSAFKRYIDKIAERDFDNVNFTMKENDPTCHAEINAIRFACRKINNYHLEHAIIFCTSEPCPMCMAAIYFANIKACYFISDKHLTAKFGFDDAAIYQEFTKPASLRSIEMAYFNNYEAEVKEIFNMYKKKGLPIC